jgi:hypothetical protein
MYPINFRLMFWSSWGVNGKDGSIEKAWMDGSHRQTMVQNLGWPIGLTVDAESRYLYWLDAMQFSVQRVKLSLDDSVSSSKREV